MAKRGTLITGGLVIGDQFTLSRRIKGITPGITITKAWLTVKSYVGQADPGVFQKEITATDTPGVGYISDNGSDGSAKLLFYITSADTLALTPGATYYYDIQVQTSSGEIVTLEYGEFTPVRQVTDDSS